MSKDFKMGGVIASKNILQKKGNIKWCIREESVNEVDNGWRFLSDIDTDDYLKDANNMVVCAWETLFEIEPAISEIYDMPVGSDFTLMNDNSKKYFVDTNTGERIKNTEL